MKKSGKKLLAILLCVALLCSITPAAFAGSIDPNAEIPAEDLAYQSALESFVLFENDGGLPLAEDSTVAVFGRAQVNVSKGGGGSGDVNSPGIVNFIEGMEHAGINYYADLYETYVQWCEENPTSAESGSGGRWNQTPSEDEMPLTTDLVSDAANNADTAIVIIARNSSEGVDRTVSKGDWYLKDDETDMLAKVTQAFDNVVVLLNVGAVIDMGWTSDYDNITAILNVWQPGNYGALAVGDVLSGSVSPSGKLASTWADYEDYPTQAVESATFGEDDDIQDYDNNGYDDPVYGEDIYVGYRYFETFAPDKVVYEFGYGQSYTTFEQSVTGYSVDGDNITVDVKVVNTGDTYSGKEVVQVYYTAPQGSLGKPVYELIAYGKTDEIAPGKTQTLSLTFAIDDMASYDDSGVTGNESCYVLEAGTYTISAGSSVKNLAVAGEYEQESLKVVEQLSEVLAPTESFQQLVPGTQNADGTYTMEYQEVSLRSDDNNVADKWETDLDFVELTGDKSSAITLGQVAVDADLMDDFIAQFTLGELVTLFGGNSAGQTPQGAAGGYGGSLIDMGLGVTVGTMADGPAGIVLTNGTSSDGTEDYGEGNTAFPIATALASTWNIELIEQVGQAMGEEAAYNNVDIWLAPGMNIHRDPLCGRNFEYYSEDPLVTGMSAAATTIGMQSQGVSVCLKHYAINSQETDRSGGDSIISERAAREIYLKGFEIAVKTANPGWLMTSYNMINGSQAASNYELCTTVLRDEWDWDGAVMTDWGGKKDETSNGLMLRAQNDISMSSIRSSIADTDFQDALNTLTTDGIVLSSDSGSVGSGDTTNNVVLERYEVNANDEIVLVKYDFNVAISDPQTPEAPSASINSTETTYICALEEVGEWGPVTDSDGNTTTKWTSKDSTGVIADLFIRESFTGQDQLRITMGEIHRSATNLFNGLIRTLNFREANGLGAYDYGSGDYPYSVTRSDVTDDVYTWKPFIEGYEDGTFGGEEYITRAETAAMIYRVIDDLDKEGDFDSRFDDVEDGEWYYQYIAYLEDQDIVDGYPDSEDFKPNEPITRAEFTKMVVELTGLGEDEGENPFDDTDDDHWAIGYILRGYNENWIEGDEVFGDEDDRNFRPDDNIFRGEATKIINRALGRDATKETIPSYVENPFSDLSTSDWYYKDVLIGTTGHTYEIDDNGNFVWVALTSSEVD